MIHSGVLEVTPGETAESWVDVDATVAEFGTTEKALAAVKAERKRQLENFMLRGIGGGWGEYLCG